MENRRLLCWRRALHMFSRAHCSQFFFCSRCCVPYAPAHQPQPACGSYCPSTSGRCPVSFVVCFSPHHSSVALRNLQCNGITTRPVVLSCVLLINIILSLHCLPWFFLLQFLSQPVRQPYCTTTTSTWNRVRPRYQHKCLVMLVVPRPLKPRRYLQCEFDGTRTCCV